MNCRELERRLEGSLGRGEPTTLDAEAGMHLASCERCRDLEEILRASLEEAPPSGPDLTAAVMARTSGAACGAAGDQLADLVDGALAGVERDLVISHLDACSSCEELAEAMRLLSRELPELAGIDPGEAFTASVLRATHQVPQARVLTNPFDPHADRLARWWRGIAGRPRFAWEAAYAGALALWLVFGAGFSPFNEVPVRALELARSNPIGSLADSVEPASLGRQAWQATGGRVIEKAQFPPERLEQLGQLKEASSSLARHGSTALGSALRGDLSGSAVRLKDMKGDLSRIYEALRRPRNQNISKPQEA